MQTKALFSQHYLDSRLPELPEWAEDPTSAFETLCALWEKAQQFGATWSEAQTEDEFIKPALTALGWSFIVQPKAKHAGRVTRPDYALFADAAAQQAAYPLQGDDVAFYRGALAIAEAKFWERPLSQKDSSGRDSWKPGENPSHQMVSYLVGTRAPWGILTNGRIWRLYSREVSSTASEFYEIDLAEVFGEGSREPEVGSNAPAADAALQITFHVSRFKRFWLFFRRAAFTPDAQGRSFVQRVHEGSATYAREISDKLKELVYAEVMPEIAAGFIAYRREQLGVTEETEASLREIYQASLSLLYKLLFLLYAEARGLLPMQNAGYREQSLTALAQWAAARLDAGQPLSTATHAAPRYEALLALFQRIDRGDPSLGIPRYNGGLFNPQNPAHAFLVRHRLSDRAVARAVDILVRDAGEPVDYAYISVRNLGAIYEGLLENKLRMANDANGEWRMANVESSIHHSPIHHSPIQLVNDKGERKATGSYYTPDYIVDYIVEHTLGPLLEARAETFAAAMARVAELRRQLERASDPGRNRLLRAQWEAAERAAREAFLGLKVLDPAMGSGHFLVNAVDFLTDGIIQRMQAFHDAHPDIPWAWNPIQQLVERVRAEILAELAAQGISVEPQRLDDTALLTRLVMKRCIYGVDLNAMAVELAKLSLWLHSFTIGAPLSFLDHHLRWGNSLIGTDVRTVEAGIQQTDSGQLGLFAGPFAGLLDLTALMVEVVDRADATLSDVQRSAEDFARVQAALTPYKQALDLWVSRHFGNAGADDFLRLFGDAVIPALKGEREVSERQQAVIAQAKALWEEKRFFHWDLEFPEVFVDLQKRDWAENPGFDAVIGNPPWGADFDNADKAWLKTFRLVEYQFDSYIAFMERSLQLLSMSGRNSFIVPDSWLIIKFARRLRNHLLTNTVIEGIVDLPQGVFVDATVDPLIYVVNKSLPNANNVTNIVLFEHAETLSDLDKPNVSFQHPQNELACDDDNRFRLSPISIADIILKRLDIVPLGELVQIGLGCKPYQTGKGEPPQTDKIKNTKPYNASQKLNEGYFPLYAGDGAQRYSSFWNGEWILYGPHLAEPRNWELFTGPRIVIQGIRNPSLERRLVATHFDQDAITNDNLTVVKIKIPSVNTFFILSLINSNFLNWFYSQKRGSFTKITVDGISILPIPRITFTTPADERARLLAEGRDLAAAWVQASTSPAASYRDFLAAPLGAWIAARLGVGSRGVGSKASGDQQPASSNQSDVLHDLLAALAADMLALNREKQAEMRGFLAWLERQIGAQVDALTGKSALQNYLGDYQKGQPPLELAELLATLRKNRRKLHADPDARAFQEPLEREYAASLEKLLPLKARLAATDRLIDLIVYRLYGLTEEEVGIVEGNGAAESGAGAG